MERIPARSPHPFLSESQFYKSPMAAAQSPPIISSADAQAAAAPPGPASSLRSFLSRASDTASRTLSERRPWPELLDRTAFSRPDSLAEATARARKNLAYFRANYLILLAASLVFFLISEPFSIVALLGLLAAWCFLYLLRPADPPLVLFGRTFSEWETLMGLVAATVIVFFFTPVVSLIITAVMAGAAIVCAHAALRVPEDLFLDDQAPGGAATGFLSSFLGGAAPAPASASAPAVVVRV